MLINVCLILLHTLLFTGCGWLVLSRLSPRELGAHAWGKAFWAGWAAIAGLLQIWHFLLPVNFMFYLLLAVGGLVGWLLYARRVVIKDICTSGHLLFAAFCLVPLFIMANHVLFSEPSYDHGLYHMQTVKWFNAFPVVRGLGNLHHRLAFNSSNLLVGSLLNSGPLTDFGVYSSNSTVMFALATQGLWVLAAWLRAPEERHSIRLFGALLLPAALWQASQYPLSGYSADTVIFALQVASGIAFLELAARQRDDDEFRSYSGLIVMLVAAGLTVKLSFAAFGLGLLIGMLILYFRSGHRPPATTSGMLWGWMALLSIWMLPWLARNILMSGFPLYPSAAAGLPVAWRLPGYLIADISAGITQWARTYSGQIEYSGDLAWLATWALRFVYEPRQALILSALLLAAGAFIAWRDRVRLNGGLLLLLATCMLSIVFWFFSAPTYRFSGAAIWLLYAGAILVAYRLICRRWGEKSGAQFAILFLLFLFYSLRTDFSKNISLGRLVIPPRESVTAEQAQPLAGLETRTTISGLMVYVPPETSPETCWNAPLPCTTRNDFLKRLQLQQPGDLGGGFYVPPSP